MNQHGVLITAGIVFSIVAVIHLSRLIFKFDFTIAGKKIPLWANALGLIIAGGLAVWMFLAA